MVGVRTEAHIFRSQVGIGSESDCLLGQLKRILDISDVVSYRRHNHPRQILSPLVKGLGGYGSPKSGIWLWMSLLQQCYTLPCYTVTVSQAAR